MTTVTTTTATITTEQATKVLQDALNTYRQSDDAKSNQLMLGVFRRMFTEDEIATGKLQARQADDEKTVCAMPPVGIDAVFNDDALRQMDLTLAVGRHGAETTPGKELINAILLSWDVPNLTEEEYNQRRQLLESYIIANEINKSRKAIAQEADSYRGNAGRWKKAPKRFSLGDFYPIVYNLADALRQFGFLYNSTDEMTQDIKSRKPFLPVLIEAINERYVCMATDDRKVKITASKEGDNNGQGNGSGNGSVFGGNADDFITDLFSDFQTNHDSVLSVEKFNDFSGANFNKTYIISEPDDWRKMLCATMMHHWQAYEAVRESLRIRHESYHSVLRTKWYNRGVCGEPFGWGAYGMAYKHKMNEFASRKYGSLNQVVALVHDANVQELKEIGGAPLFIIQDAYDITAEAFKPVQEDYETVKRLGYQEVVEVYEKIVKEWQDRMGKYRQMLEECNEDYCEILPKHHRLFGEGAWDAYNNGILAGNKEAIYNPDDELEDVQRYILCRHPEYRRGYRFAFRNTVCPYCTTFYEYDKARDGEEITCTGCDRVMVIKRGTLVSKAVYDQSSVCEITGNKDHQFRSFTSSVTDKRQASIPNSCVCGAVRKDLILENGLVWISPWSEGKQLRSSGFSALQLP